MKKERIPIWLLTAAYFLVFLATVFFNGYGLIFGIISIVCGVQCYSWAKKLKKDARIGFSIGFLFNLFGLLGYYIYYMLKE